MCNYIIDWTAIGAILSGFGTLALGVAALLASDAWRSETVGRKKLELAENALTKVYQAKDKVAYARNAFSSGEEGKFETDIGDEVRRNFAFSMNVPAKRLLDEDEFFAELKSSKYLLQAHFGDDAVSIFEDILRARHKVIVASQMVVRAVTKNYHELHNQQEHIQRMKDIMWDMAPSEGPEEIRDDVNSAVARAEELFGRELENSSKRFSKMFSFFRK